MEEIELTEEEKIKKEKKSKYNKLYREKNKEKLKEYNKKYHKENIVSIKERQKSYNVNNKEKQRTLKKIYYKNNRERLLAEKKKYGESHKNEKRKYDKEYLLNLKMKAFEILGGCQCVICGDKDVKHMTIDHIDEKGHIDRKNGFTANKIHSAIANGKLTKEHLNNLRVLCYNHNCSRTRKYLELSYEEQSYPQRFATKLWKEAFNFFGPCPCKETELKFLTVSHINNDGAEKRRNGEGSSKKILINFHKQGWPESLKENYRLECYNCNCGRSNEPTPTV